MKTLAQIFLLMLIPTFLYSQDLTGQWSGSLRIQGTSLRVVFHVSRINNDYAATLDSPDQNANGIQVTTVIVNPPNIKFEIASAGAVFEGIISGKAITGKWVQSGTAFFLALLRE